MKIKPITNESELKQAIELDKKTYKDETLMGSLEKCKKWLGACPDMYISIYDNEKMVGYINFVPLTPKCFKKFKNGEMSDYEIDASDILPYHKGENLCLLMSIVVDKKYQNGETIKILTNALFVKRFVVAALVQEMPFGGAQVFGPLLFQMDERPLAAAEAEMLDAGHLQVTVGVHQASLWQVTPAGRSASTVTR